MHKPTGKTETHRFIIVSIRTGIHKYFCPGREIL